MHLDAEQLSKVFPFHILLDRNLRLVQIGATLERLLPHMHPGDAVDSHLFLQRPKIGWSWEGIVKRSTSMFLVGAHEARSLLLKGQMLPVGEHLWFLGSPWVTDLQDLNQLGLGLRDFAPHDPIGDYLVLLQTQRASAADATRMASQLAEVNRELERKIDEIHNAMSELRHAMSEREQALEVAQAAERVRSGFLANMSHELRTPLNAIIGYSDLLLEDAEDPVRSDMLRIHSAATHLLRLINDILDISKIDAGKFTIWREPFLVRDLVTDLEQTTAPLARKNNNRFSIVFSDGWHDGMYSDRTRLKQCLINLVGNAMKFTHNGNIVLRIEGDDQQVQFHVSDTGVGLSRRDLNRIFDEFVQGDHRAGGTGLGLSLTRRLCHLMGGDVTAMSELGRGSVFTLTLPRTMEAVTPCDVALAVGAGS